MGLYIFGGDHDLYVEGSNIMIDNRGHRTIYKRFHSEVEATAYMQSMIDKGKPKKTPEEYRQTNSKHRKSHRLKRPK